MFRIERFALLTVLLFVISCAGIQTISPQAIAPPKFSFEPPSVETKKNNIVLGILRPIYDTGFLTIPIMTSESRMDMRNVVGYFTKSMAVDFEKIVVARGYKSKGPFHDLSSMTYLDKKGSDLLLSSGIFLSTNYSTNGKGISTIFPAKDGVLTIAGFMDLVVLEPLSGEKMWIKRIDFEPVSANYRFSYYDTGTIKKVQFDTRPEALKTALEQIYPKIMDTAWKYLYPEEILYLKKESQEIRERKQY